MTTIDAKVTRTKDLRQLLRLLAQDEDGLREYVYPRLKFGDMWWIPDAVSGFGEKQRHPWVIVQGYSPRRATVRACPRTTDTRNTQSGIITPGHVLPGLDQDGLIVLKFRRLFIAKDFRTFEYLGRLPQDWVRKIQDFYRALAGGKMAK